MEQSEFWSVISDITPTSPMNVRQDRPRLSSAENRRNKRVPDRHGTTTTRSTYAGLGTATNAHSGTTRPGPAAFERAGRRETRARACPFREHSTAHPIECCTHRCTYGVALSSREDVGARVCCTVARRERRRNPVVLANRNGV